MSDNGKCWSRVAALLEDRYEIVAYDALYHGLSDAPESGAPAGAAELIAVVEELALERPALMGHSMGAATVAEAAGMRPELFSCAVLEDPPWRDSFPEKRRPATDWRSLTVDQAIDVGKELYPAWHADEFPAWAESKLQFRPAGDWMKQLPRAVGRWREVAAAVSVPALLVCGGDSEGGAIVTPEIADEAQSLNPRVGVVRFEGAGHNVRRDAFDEFSAAVARFLDAH